MYVPIYYIIVMLRVQSVRKTISKSIQYIQYSLGRCNVNDNAAIVSKLIVTYLWGLD